MTSDPTNLKSHERPTEILQQPAGASASLSPGVRFGQYTILSALGFGGMGQVFRARDSRLGREVAIKILPGGPSPNVDLVRRFESEARSASSLNHPNIVTIYELGRVDSIQYIAMELIDGKTLRQLLLSGPMPM